MPAPLPGLVSPPAQLEQWKHRHPTNDPPDSRLHGMLAGPTGLTSRAPSKKWSMLSSRSAEVRRGRARVVPEGRSWCGRRHGETRPKHDPGCDHESMGELVPGHLVCSKMRVSGKKSHPAAAPYRFWPVGLHHLHPRFGRPRVRVLQDRCPDLGSKWQSLDT